MKEQLVQGDTLIRDATEIEKFLEKELSAACKRIEEQPHEILDRLYQELLAAKLLTPEAKKIWRRHMNAYTKSNT
jgi:hypothetical protein